MVLAAAIVSGSIDSARNAGTARRGGPPDPLVIVVAMSFGCCGAGAATAASPSVIARESVMYFIFNIGRSGEWLTSDSDSPQAAASAAVSLRWRDAQRCRVVRSRSFARWTTR